MPAEVDGEELELQRRSWSIGYLPQLATTVSGWEY